MKRIFTIRLPAKLALLWVVFMLGVALPSSHALAEDEQAGMNPERLAHEAMARNPPDWDAARRFFMQAAESGSDRAMSYLGWIYETGQGVTADGARAAYWYARAVDAGAMDYAVKLGWMYLAGEGVPRDRQQAESWFKRAIDAGHAKARTALASVLIADAQGGRDPERVMEARELLEGALVQGHSLAAFFLARLYLEGISGHPIDDERAAHYTRIGAEAGHPQMQGWLALMLHQGRGLERDDVEALSWAIQAAANDDVLGQQLRPFIEADLGTDEQVEAQRRATLRSVSPP